MGCVWLHRVGEGRALTRANLMGKGTSVWEVLAQARMHFTGLAGGINPFIIYYQEVISTSLHILAPTTCATLGVRSYIETRRRRGSASFSTHMSVPCGSDCGVPILVLRPRYLAFRDPNAGMVVVEVHPSLVAVAGPAVH